jgi:hypothetical protein
MSVTVPLSATGTSSATLQILDDVSNAPGTMVLDSITFNPISGTPTLRIGSSTHHPLLTAGTAYWLMGTLPVDCPAQVLWYGPDSFVQGSIWFSNSGKVFKEAIAAFALNGESVPGDSDVDFTNTGADNAQDICVNTYTFAPDEQLISCCSCRVTRNALWSLSATRDLVSNSLTADVPGSVVIKLLATAAPAGNCNPANPGPPVQGLAAWGTTLHWSNLTPTATGSVPYWTETPFTNATLSNTELSIMTSYCGLIQSNGSGYGICKGCQTGSLGLGPNDPSHNTGLGSDKQ